MENEEIYMNRIDAFESSKFTSEEAGKVLLDGYEYKTIIIKDSSGLKWQWFAENLKISHFIDGSEIKSVQDKDEWMKFEKTPKCCIYKEEPNNQVEPNAYGKLYNWYAIENICPEGWRIPTLADWMYLTAIVGCNGNHLKETGNAHWGISNQGTNLTGFTALPGGARMTDGEFKGYGNLAVWWSSTSLSISSSTCIPTQNACYYRMTQLPCVNVFRAGKNNAFSVRLMKDLINTK